MKNLIDIEDFLKINISTGTIIDAQLNPRARKPAYTLIIDFGEQGIKTSSAQLTENYTAEDLRQRQVIAVMNFPPRRVAGVQSEVLVLAAVSPDRGAILLTPASPVENGISIR